MQVSAKTSDGSRRGGITALAAAWLILLAVVTAGATYVVLARQAAPPPDAPLLSVTLRAAPPADAVENPETAGGETGASPARLLPRKKAKIVRAKRATARRRC